MTQLRIAFVMPFAAATAMQWISAARAWITIKIFRNTSTSCCIANRTGSSTVLNSLGVQFWFIPARCRARNCRASLIFKNQAVLDAFSRIKQCLTGSPWQGGILKRWCEVAIPSWPTHEALIKRVPLTGRQCLRDEVKSPHPRGHPWSTPWKGIACETMKLCILQGGLTRLKRLEEFNWAIDGDSAQSVQAANGCGNESTPAHMEANAIQKHPSPKQSPHEKRSRHVTRMTYVYNIPLNRESLRNFFWKHFFCLAIRGV